ncbi:MAG: response regulator transcription factor [Lachnospiraceae bacterium]|nr:response regulator transcription factor [Lachnospiraceae bacterium]
MKQILVVDDEKDIRTMLKDCLEMEGYLVYTAADGEQALEELRHPVDLILLDVNLPDIDGYSICGRIRDIVFCPILFLTARTQEGDRINGLKAGGDDYILKPFSIDELLARIEAHLRREERRQGKMEVYVNQEITVDFDGHRVLCQGEELNLTKTEFAILELLLTHAGRVFEKEQIYEKVRGYDAEADANIVTEHIRRIRKKMKAFCEKEYIETVWGVGYKWIG